MVELRRLEPLTPTLPGTDSVAEQAVYKEFDVVGDVVRRATVVSVVVKTVVKPAQETPVHTRRQRAFDKAWASADGWMRCRLCATEGARPRCGGPDRTQVSSGHAFAVVAAAGSVRTGASVSEVDAMRVLTVCAPALVGLGVPCLRWHVGLAMCRALLSSAKDLRP